MSQPHDAGRQAQETHRLTTERLQAQAKAAAEQAAHDRATLAAHYAAQRAAKG